MNLFVEAALVSLSLAKEVIGFRTARANSADRGRESCSAEIKFIDDFITHYRKHNGGRSTEDVFAEWTRESLRLKHVSYLVVRKVICTLALVNDLRTSFLTSNKLDGVGAAQDVADSPSLAAMLNESGRLKVEGLRPTGLADHLSRSDWDCLKEGPPMTVLAPPNHLPDIAALSLIATRGVKIHIDMSSEDTGAYTDQAVEGYLARKGRPDLCVAVCTGSSRLLNMPVLQYSPLFSRGRLVNQLMGSLPSNESNKPKRRLRADTREISSALHISLRLFCDNPNCDVRDTEDLKKEDVGQWYEHGPADQVYLCWNVKWQIQRLYLGAPALLGQQPLGEGGQQIVSRGYSTIIFADDNTLPKDSARCQALFRALCWAYYSLELAAHDLIELKPSAVLNTAPIQRNSLCECASRIVTESDFIERVAYDSGLDAWFKQISKSPQR